MPTIDISVTVPAEIVDAVTAWRLKQVIDTETGELKYPNNVALLQEIIKQAVQRIIDQEPTASIQAELDAIEVSRAAIQAIKDSAVT